MKVEPTSQPSSSIDQGGDLERSNSNSRSVCIDRSSKPYEYLKNIPKNDDELHIIKGCIVTLATKLSVNTSTVKKEWQLSVIITDGSASRQVNISMS